MHREEHGVELRADLSAFSFEQAEKLADDRHILPGERQLPADGQCQRATNHQHDQRRHQELDADDLVVERKDVFLNERLLMMSVRMIIRMTVSIESRRNSCHVRNPEN